MTSQVEEGFTKVPNDLLEALARMRINGEARQLLDVILRKTFGWNKKEDWIPLSQFCLLTGIKKPNVIRGLKTLVEMQIIIKTDNRKSITWRINRSFSTWKPLSKLITLSKPITSVIENDNKSLSELIPSKESTKERISKEKKKSAIASPEALRLSGILFDSILKGIKNTRLEKFNSAKRENTLKLWALDIDKLLRIDGQKPSLVEEVILFSTNDDFWMGNILSGQKLRVKWDALVAKMQRIAAHNSNGGSPKKTAPQIEMPYVPPTMEQMKAELDWQNAEIEAKRQKREAELGGFFD
ncbi:MAG: replication protein [Nitrospirae bacterium]|nr:replication protein [Nitrospirota bacterium]